MLKTTKVAAGDLAIGMYVSGLDRPWLETPFITQGFIIESQEDILRLRKYCEYVYVDSQRSQKPQLLVRREVMRPRAPAAPAAERKPAERDVHWKLRADDRLSEKQDRQAALLNHANLGLQQIGELHEKLLAVSIKRIGAHQLPTLLGVDQLKVARIRVEPYVKGRPRIDHVAYQHIEVSVLFLP